MYDSTDSNSEESATLLMNGERRILFMDNVTPFGKNYRIVQAVQMFCWATGTEFGLSWCSVFVRERGKRVKQSGITLRMDR